MSAGRFEKVTFEQFEQDWLKQFPSDSQKVREIYENITLPKRATRGSAGYDFVIPCDLSLAPKQTKLIPTGIRVKIEDGHVYINGKLFEEPYLSDDVVTTSEVFYDFIVPEGYIFAMGDNRGASTDCRVLGCIPLEKIEGIVIYRFCPLNVLGKVD